MGRVLSAYGKQLTKVPSFEYLGRMLLSTNNDWPEMEQNLRRVQGKWVRLEEILGREVADKRTVRRYTIDV